MLEMAKKSSFIMVTLINNGEMYLKINFTLYCFSVLRNIFNFIWLLFEGINIVKPQFLVIPNINIKYQPI